jgi:hypothetical protein
MNKKENSISTMFSELLPAVKCRGDYLKCDVCESTDISIGRDNSFYCSVCHTKVERLSMRLIKQLIKSYKNDLDELSEVYRDPSCYVLFTKNRKVKFLNSVTFDNGCKHITTVDNVNFALDVDKLSSEYSRFLNFYIGNLLKDSKYNDFRKIKKMSINDKIKFQKATYSSDNPSDLSHNDVLLSEIYLSDINNYLTELEDLNHNHKNLFYSIEVWNKENNDTKSLKDFLD